MELHKFGLFVFGLIIMAILVYASQYNVSHYFNKDETVYLTNKCMDLGLQPDECIRKLFVTKIERMSNEEKYTKIDKIYNQIKKYPIFVKPVVYALNRIKDGATDSRGIIIYKCVESNDEIDKQICPFGVTNNGHTCWLNEGLTYNQTCVNSVWTRV